VTRDGRAHTASSTPPACGLDRCPDGAADGARCIADVVEMREPSEAKSGDPVGHCATVPLYACRRL
jgi:hypothetical protein